MTKTVEMMKEMSIDKEIEVENVRMNTLRRALLMKLKNTVLEPEEEKVNYKVYDHLIERQKTK
jgi:hypothetical protein